MSPELIARSHNERLRELLLRGELEELDKLTTALNQQLQESPETSLELLRSVDDLPRQTLLKWLSSPGQILSRKVN